MSLVRLAIPALSGGARLLIVGVLALGTLLLTAHAQASDLPDAFADIAIEPKLGTTIPVDGQFLDETGRAVRLADYLGGPPVVLAPVAYTCPNLCGSALADLAFALERVPLTPGRDYRLIAVSIDPREGPAEAAAAKARAFATSSRPQLAEASHFLTSAEASGATLLRAIGFRYRWDEDLQQYAHLSGIALITPEGRLARWLGGVGLEPRDLRLAIAEAGQGGIGGLGERFLLLCSHYDPRTGRYTSLVQGMLRIGGGLTVLALAGPITFAVVRERRLRRAREGV